MSCCYLVELFTNLIFSNYESKYIFNDTRFYYLSLKRNNLNSNWYINGLWPQYSMKSYPRFCRETPFNFEKLDPIISELKSFWFKKDDINDINNPNFWKHEWLKHGTCMFNESDEFNYFKKIIQLYLYVIENNKIKDYIKEENSNHICIPFNLNFEII